MAGLEEVIEERIREVHEECMEELLEVSKTLRVSNIDPDSLMEAMSILMEDGFDASEVYVVNRDGFLKGEVDDIHSVNGKAIWADGSVPEGVAIAFHANALVPTPPNILKPYHIYKPEGIVSIEEKDFGDSLFSGV